MIQPLGIGLDFLEHRHDLFLVIGRRRDVRGKDEHRLGINYGLSIEVLNPTQN